MQVTQGLIIADPWICYVLDGSKTWEMRSSKTSVRGPFGLIRKGTGAIWGIATLADVGRALTPTEMLASCEAKPVRYDHPSGAVTWVNLADDVSRAITDQLAVAQPAAGGK